MVRWQAAAGGLAVAAAAGIGIFAGPVVHGQAQTRRESVPKVLRVLTGQGSWIGVSVSDLDEPQVQQEKLANAGGVRVDEVSSDSPAQAAGLKTGDVIVEYDGERVRGTRQFARLVQETPAGRRVQATVIRSGQRVPVTIAPREGDGMRYFGDIPRMGGAVGIPKPAPPAVPAVPVPPAPPVPPAARDFLFDWDGLAGPASGRLGVTVMDLQPQLADYFGTKDGVLVSSVTEGSVAAKAGVKAGDVITAINKDTVSSPSELRRRSLELKDGEEFTFGIVRDRKPMTLKGKAEAPTARRRTRT